MTKGFDAKGPEVVVGQIVQEIRLDRILLQRNGVLAKPEGLEPLSDVRHVRTRTR